MSRLRVVRILALPFYSQRERRLRLWLRLVLTGLILFLLSLVIEAAFKHLTGSPAWRAVRPYIATLLVVIIGILASRLLLDRERALLAPVTVATELAIGFIMAGLALGTVFALALAAGWIEVESSVFTAGAERGVLQGSAISLAVFVCVGIYEEVVARGYLLPNLAQAVGHFMPARWAVVVGWGLSSALFGLAHAWNPNASALSTLLIILAGLMLGLGTVLTGRLGLAIGIHIGWNWFLGSVFGFAVSGVRITEGSLVTLRLTGPELWTGGAFGPEAGLLGVVGFAAVAGFVLAWTRLREGRLELHSALARHDGRWVI